MSKQKNLVILGSTGSIGRNSLDVVRSLPDINVWGLSGWRNLGLLREQVEEFCPCRVVVADPELKSSLTATLVPPDSSVSSAKPAFHSNWFCGPEYLDEMASHPDVDIVIASIVGQAGLASAVAASRAGKRLALANKEALVVAGDLVCREIKAAGGEILPIDSEHSAIWQAALAGQRSEIRRVILTASGGPFRHHSAEDLKSVTVADALNHPNWSMGAKISIDSATLVNKALEIIEAKWLFGLTPDQISVMIHPQSTVHSMVEFVDGSVVAQMGPPDMKLPIQYALTYPHRVPGVADKVNWSQAFSLDLFPPNEIQSAALELGFLVCERGGTSGAVFNAANEVAVAAFLDNRLPFHLIVPYCRDVLEQHQIVNSPTYDELCLADRWAREEMNKCILT